MGLDYPDNIRLSRGYPGLSPSKSQNTFEGMWLVFVASNPL